MVVAVAYLLITGVAAVVSRARARVGMLVCAAIAGVVVLLPVGVSSGRCRCARRPPACAERAARRPGP
jgi:hypothetical protein